MIINTSDVGKLVVLSIKQNWGPGKITKIEKGYAYIRFRDCGDTMARKYPLQENPLIWATNQTDERLDEMLATKPRKKRETAAPFRLLDFNQALEIFKTRYPKTFSDPLYRGGPGEGGQYVIEDMARKFHAAFGDGQLLQMVENHSLHVITDRAEEILQDQDLIYRGELKSFMQLLRDEKEIFFYFKSLANVLGPVEVNEGTLRPYFETVNACSVQGFGKWPNATLFPFLARPECHMLVKSNLTKTFATHLGHPLAYEHHPNWRTYSAIMEMSAGYLVLLKPFGARDYLDVYSFMRVVSEGVGQKTTIS
jgi:hypothetical protein